MLKICSIILCLFLISTNNVYMQDKIAKTAEGQTIILQKDGTWHVKNNIDIHDNKAITDDGELFLLGRDGKWFLMNTIRTSPSQQQESNQYIEKNYNSSDGILTIPYSSATVAGTACVHLPASTKSGFAGPRPLMLLLDPSGNAAGIVARWQHAADRFGWIIASTPAIMNGTPSDQDLQHLLALLDAVVANWPIDRRAMILGGFSGGACAAYRHALERPDLFRGAIVECGHMGPFRDLQNQIRPGSLFFLATRIHDFNAPAMHTLAKAFEDRGENVKIIELPGGHEPLTGADADGALEWINSQIK
jgi:predicted esterase